MSIKMVKQIVRSEIILDEKIVSQEYQINTNGYCLTIDMETHTDIAQKAKILMFTLFNLEEASHTPEDISYVSKGMVVYDLNENELAILKTFCKEHDLHLINRDNFVNQLLFKALSQGAMLIGHNIPFDVGAMASDFEIIPDTKKFRFKLCFCGEAPDTVHTHDKIAIPCSLHPTIIIEQVKTRKYIMYIEAHNQGAIVDTITLGNALLGAGKSGLGAMVKRYGFTDMGKKEVETYHGEYDAKFYEYAMHDVYLTSILISAQYRLYKEHRINKPFYTIMSEASIGKAYNEKLGIPPFRIAHKEVAPFMYTLANIAYYGARSEVHERLSPVQIAYTDFKSQYPLVNALLNSQSYLLAQYLKIDKCVELAQDILERIQIEDLKDKETWKMLSILVKVNTHNDVLPCKVEIQGVKLYGTQVISGTTNWYSMLDLVASKIRTGKAPEVIDAYRLVPYGSIQTNEIDVLGNSNYHVDLRKDDFFVKVIDLRDSVKSELKQVKKQIKEAPCTELYQRKNYLENLQLALKLMANSTSYGILMETREVNRQDIAGKYNSMPVGTHIISGARLLLAIAEQLGLDRGIEHAFCDTDSFAYAKPDNMSEEEFYTKVDECIKWFNPLSLYASTGDIFELEEYNFQNGKRVPLYALCVSAKRYVIYNKLENGKFLIRKLSEHGVTAYLTDLEIPLPEDMLEIERNELGQRIHKPERYALWYRAIELAEKSIYPYVPLEEWSSQFAITQVTISTPKQYQYFSYIPNLRPFCFYVVTPKSRFKNRKDRYYSPYIPYASLIQDMIKQGKVCKVPTNEIVTEIDIDTIHDRLSDFFLHTERKSANGNSTGTMQRRIIEDADIEQRLRSGKKLSEVQQLRIWQ